MRILFLNQTFHPDVVATSQYLSDVAATLAARGHDVTVMCSRRAYDDPAVRYPRRESWRGVAIRRISCSGFGKGSRWRRAADFGTYIANCARHLALLPGYDVVVGMTSPPLISWLGALFTRVKGGRFIFWVMDLNPDEALAAGWLRESSLSTRFLKAILRDSLQASASVVVLDRFMADRIERKGIERQRIVVLPPWSHDDEVRYDEAGRDDFRRQHGFDRKFVVMHSGNHTPCHPLTTLLDAARQLREDENVQFCFAGGGSQLAAVRDFVSAHGLTNVSILGYQPLNRLSASLSAADLHVVVMGEPYVGIIHPCKVYNIRALGIPYLYIGPERSHIAELLPPYTAAHGDANATVRHIRTAADLHASGAARRAIPVVNRDVLLGQLTSILENAAPVSSQRKLYATP